MQNLINFISENGESLLAIYGGVVLIATTIVKLTPSVKDDEILGKIIKVLDVFSTAFTAADKKILEDRKKDD